MEFLRAATLVSGPDAQSVPCRRHARRAAISALCAIACTLIAPVARAQATTQTFTYTGGQQTFTVPAGVFSVQVLAVGGRGGAARPGGAGGAAAQVSGNL